MKSVLIMSDLHMPFHDRSALRKAIKFCGQKKPDVILINGDLADQYAASRFPRQVNLMTNEEEIRLFRKYAEEMFYTLQRVSPKSKIILTRGNHCVRLNKRIQERLPELVGVFDFDSLFAFDGVETIYNPRDYVKIDDCYYMHGWYTKPGQTVDYFQHSVAIGHSHKAYVVYRKLKNKTIFELNSGHMADYTTVPMSYMPSKYTKSITSMAFKDELGPRVILL